MPNVGERQASMQSLYSIIFLSVNLVYCSQWNSNRI